MASSSLSGRSLTSLPPSSEAISESTQPSVQPPQSPVEPWFEGTFVPHVYDFVSVFGPVSFHGRSQIPPLYLEPLAVDQSVTIGHGASFTTFKRAIPPAPERSITHMLDGLSISMPQARETRPKHVVYKIASVAFMEDGTPTPQTRHAMKAALMELYSLRHPPLQSHPNIVKLLGLAWGANHFDPSHRLPVLVVELADRGNLAQLQQTTELAPIVRSRLAIDIGEGLSMLHRCGIIHGDMKSENILVFSDPEKEYVAKISDFGFSMVGEAAKKDVYVGGTRTWKAPEAKSPVPKDLLQATDVYSYGLLLWRLATDGQDPFRFWVSSTLKGEAYLQELERIKEEDQPVQNTSLENWFIPYILSKSKYSSAELSTAWLAEAMFIIQAAMGTTGTQEAGQPGASLSTTAWEPVMRYLVPCLSYPQVAEALLGPLLQWATGDDFYGRMPSALGKCLSIDPAKRNLHEALNALTGNSQPQLGPQENGRDILLRMSYDHHVLSWQQMRELEPAVQSFVFQSFRAKVEGLLSQQRVNAPDCFVLTSYYINGYGTKVNLEEAKRLFQICSNANYKHPPSRAYAYRIWKFLNPNFVTSESMITNLIQMALDGSRMAAMDLKEVAPDKYPEIETLIRDVLAGVGGNFFHAKEMLHGYVYDQWVRTFDNQEVLVQNFKNLNRIADYKVNKRGDGILHMAANTGRIQAIETLLANFPGLTLDQLNDKRETPLLCASRAGQVATVLRLVELGANASIVALNGESCLHWLVSFKDDDLDVIGGALIQGGADLRVFTREKVAHSVFWPTIEVDHQVPGTPLNWAVHHNRARIIQFLLNKASDAMICLDRATNLVGPSPLEYAAYYHHLECLELMLEALDEAKITYSLEPIIRAGVHSADTFSMILRHGARYKERLHRFLDFCLQKSKGIVFMTGMGGFDTHLLYYAVSEGHDEVVEYLLSDEGRSLVESLDIKSNAGQSRPGVYDPSDINRPAREDRRTPVLEAIRWNRKSIVELLITNGADPKALAKNPFSDEMNWTGFHIFAIAGHNTDYSELVPFLIETGVPIDGIPSSDANDLNGPAETPFLVAVQHNAFNLATTFLEHGADPNALCVSSGLLSLEFPTTILGQIVAASSQHTIPRLRYLLEQCPKSNAIEFIVEPARQLSVLHRAAWAHKGIKPRVPDESNGSALSREEYDMVVNRDIMHELLQKWGDPETHLNVRCQIHGRTALHMAVEAGNLKAAELMVEKGADVSVCDDLGLTPVDLAGERLNELGDQRSGEQEVYAALISLLMGDRAVFFK